MKMTRLQPQRRDGAALATCWTILCQRSCYDLRKGHVSCAIPQLKYNCLLLVIEELSSLFAFRDKKA